MASPCSGDTGELSLSESTASFCVPEWYQEPGENRSTHKHGLAFKTILPPGRQKARVPPATSSYGDPLLSQVRSRKIWVCHREMEWLLALVSRDMFVSSFICDLDRLAGLKSRIGPCQYNQHSKNASCGRFCCSGLSSFLCSCVSL